MWNRLSIRRPSTAVPSRNAVEAEMEEELETKKDVFDFFEKKRSQDLGATLSTDPRNSISDRSSVRSPRRPLSRTTSTVQQDELLSSSPKDSTIGTRRSTLSKNQLLTTGLPTYQPRSSSPAPCSSSHTPPSPQRLNFPPDECPSTSDAGVRRLRIRSH